MTTVICARQENAIGEAIAMNSVVRRSDIRMWLRQKNVRGTRRRPVSVKSVGIAKSGSGGVVSNRALRNRGRATPCMLLIESTVDEMRLSPTPMVNP